jgi:hypothetical protein
MRRPALLAALLLLGAATGCATDQGYFPIIATRPVDLDLRGVDVAKFPVKRGVGASDTRVTSFFFIPTEDGPRLDRAVERALEHNGGDLMARVHVHTRQYWLPFISWETLSVVGDTVDIPNVDQPPGPVFSALSTQNAPVIGYQIAGAPRVDGIEAEALVQFILWIPTNVESPTLQQVVDQALFRGNGNLITGASVEHWWWVVPFVYGQEGWRVRGAVVRAN